jgi:hypothetical protein
MIALTSWIPQKFRYDLAMVQLDPELMTPNWSYWISK